jgi:hypothetical protein
LRSTELGGLPAQTAYLAGAAAAAALLSSAVDRSYLEPQESLGISYMPIYLAAALASSAIAAYYIVRHYRSVARMVDAYIVALTFLSGLTLCSYSYWCAGWSGLAAPAALALAVALGLRGARSASYTVAGMMAGVLLAIVLPFSWAPYVLLAFAAYDALSVFRGPLRAVPRDMDVLMIDLGDVRVGAGDVTFYSFAASSLELSRGPALAAAGVIALAAGVALTLALLRRTEGPLPGLTLPLALCSVLFFLRFRWRVAARAGWALGTSLSWRTDRPPSIELCTTSGSIPLLLR